uniref:Roadblock/LAMTOR2 domain-containing protein n=1 Tax=Timema douglasi TaxID=61478 RepID=A0A7R8VNZ5_TIMDO|nr:unnamed protein product [Timema douglasi]
MLTVPIKTTLSDARTTHYVALLNHLTNRTRWVLKDLDPTNDLTSLRIRSKKHEIIVVPGTGKSPLIRGKEVIQTPQPSRSSLRSLEYLWQQCLQQVVITIKNIEQPGKETNNQNTQFGTIADPVPMVNLNNI